MNAINDYFKTFSDKLLYLNLKENSQYESLKDLELPIYSKDFSEKIKTNELENSLSLETIIDGMLINIAIDPNFKYVDDYIELVQKYVKSIADYTATKAMEFEKVDEIKATLFYRAGYIINPFNNYNAYNYARKLWPIAYNQKEKDKEQFISSAIEILQTIIARDEEFPLSYYELANIYVNLGEYVKARNYYNNALRNVENELAKEEIRSKLEQIEDNANIEQAIYYIGKSNYNEAIRLLTKTIAKTKRPDAYYYLAVCYQNINQLENSIQEFLNALDKGGEFKEIYNDLAVSYYLNKENDKALKVLDHALKKYPEDPKLQYNKLQINISSGNLKQAKLELENLLSYDDLSDEIFNNLMIIKEQFKL
ncbi:MAG: tetratricopeptide repeat protein [Tissierellia bacterium]|nr:tetratricopeptide repeat protein [Tissierellia bacterium]